MVDMTGDHDVEDMSTVGDSDTETGVPLSPPQALQLFETGSCCSASSSSSSDSSVNYDVSSPESQWGDEDTSSDEQRRCTIQHRDHVKHPRRRSPF